jgi:hypothetical protein
MDYKNSGSYSTPLSLTDLRAAVKSLRDEGLVHNNKWSRNNLIPLLKEFAVMEMKKEKNVISKIQINAKGSEKFISCPTSEK